MKWTFATAVILLFFLQGERCAGQREVDSLKALLLTAAEDTNKVKLLAEIGGSYHDSDPQLTVKYGLQALALAKNIGYTRLNGRLEQDVGYAYNKLGDLPRSVEHFNKCIRWFEARGDSSRTITAHYFLSGLYAQLDDSARAVEQMRYAYHQELSKGTSHAQIEGLRGMGNTFRMVNDTARARAHLGQGLALAIAGMDSNAIALVLFDIGKLDHWCGDPAKALKNFDRSLTFLGSRDDIGFRPSLLLAMGNAYSSSGKLDSAVLRVTEARLIAKESDDRYSQTIAYNRLCRFFLKLGTIARAIDSGDSALSLARETKNVGEETMALNGLMMAHRAAGHHDEAYRYLDLYLASSDSTSTVQGKSEVTRMTALIEYGQMLLTDSLLHAHELELKATEIRKQKLVRNGSLGGLALVAVFAGIFLLQRNRIGKEKKRSDELLLNILPEEVAEELKATGAAKAREFDSATILFTDFKGFTTISEKLSPTELVDELNACFKAFDHIITSKGIEKIKTIGDAYMAVGGLPDPKTSSPVDVVMAALEMQDFMIARKTERDALGKPAFEMRVGIHTGPVVAGIVGVKKFAYDIWGDTVNIASRMESSSEVGAVNISEATYGLVNEAGGLSFTSRGRVQAKGKGELEMFFVQRAPVRA